MPESDKMEVEEVTKTQKCFQWPVHKVPDIFFTEAIFQKFSDTPPYIEMLKMYKGPHPDDNTKPQPQEQNPTKGMTGLETPKPGFRFPHYSQLTEGLIKFYLYLNHTYGVQRKRVVSDREAKEYQQWVNFQKQLAMEQKEFQTFAQQVAMSSPEDYAVFLPGSVQYMEKCLEDNKTRVLKYPRFYRMNESLSLNADPVLPSDPQLTLSQGPMYQDDIQLLYCNKLGKGSEEVLCRGDQIVPNTEKETSRIHQSDWQSDADIVVSIKALETLVDNHHLENHPHQWEIPFTVTTSSQSAEKKDGITTKLVVLEDPFACHNYYPYEANHLLANTLLKQHVQRSGKTFAETTTPARGGMQYFRKHFCVKKTDECAARLDGDHTALDKKEISSPVPGGSICDVDQSGDLKDTLKGEKETKEECSETEDPPDKKLSERTDVTSFAADENNVGLGLDEENVKSGEVAIRNSLQDVDIMQSSQAKGLDESADDSSKSKNVSDFIGKDPSFLDSGSNLEKLEENRKSFEEEDQVSPGRRMTRGMAKQMEHSSESVSKPEVSESPTRAKSEVPSPESVNRRVTRSATKRSQGDEGGPIAKRVTRCTAALTTAVEKEGTVSVKTRSRKKLNVCEENDKMLESEEKSQKSGEGDMSDKGVGRGDGESNLDEKLVAGSSTAGEIPKVEKLEVEENAACIIDNSESSDDELRIDLKEDSLDEKSSRTNCEKVAKKTDLSGAQSAPKTRLRKRNVPLTKEGLKGKNVEEKEAAKPSTVPLLDNILQLQRTYLAKKKNNQEVKTDLKKESEPLSSCSLLMDNILHDQTTLLTKMGSATACPLPSENSMQNKKDGQDKNILKEMRANASIWKIGKLKMCVSGSVDGLYWDYNAKRIFPATVWAKMEHQPWLGFEQVSMGEASRLWLRAAVFPQSKVIRGRIHCHSSNIMKWEVLGLNNLVTGSQFQPAYTTKVLHSIFTKLQTLDDGSYLLVHHAGDKQAFIYSTVEEEKAQRFIIYDLHAKHLDAKIHRIPPPVVPWAPLDPSLLLPGSVNSLPCIFPPSPYLDKKEYYKVRRFSPMAGVPRQKKKKKKKNKGKKNAANKEEGR